MKFTLKITKPENGYAGWRGVLVAKDGSSKWTVKARDGYTVFDSKEALVRAAQKWVNWLA
jgi:hypothetical protein